MCMDLDMPTRMLTNPFMMCKGTKGGERGEQHLGHQSGARVICKWNSVMLTLFVTPTVSLYLTHCISLCALFIESRVDKVQTGKLGENSRNHRNCRCIYSLPAGAAAIAADTRCSLLSWLTQCTMSSNATAFGGGARTSTQHTVTHDQASTPGHARTGL